MALTQISTQGIKDGTITGTDLATNVDLVDSQKLRLGAGNDLEIFHDGSNSKIVDSGTGSLIIQTSKFNLDNAAGSENIITGTENGAVKLYHNGSLKFETTSIGVDITGTTTDDGARHDGDVYFIGATSGRNAVWDMSDNALEFADSAVASFGDSSDFRIFHNGSDSVLQDQGTGSLIVLSNRFHIKNAANNESIAQFIENGAVELYHNNNKKFETVTGGATITGVCTATSFAGDGSSLSGINTDLVSDTSPQLGGDLDCNQKGILLQDRNSGNQGAVKWGDNGEMWMFHAGSDNTNRIYSSGKEWAIWSGASNDHACLKVTASDTAPAVELYYDNSKKFETYQYGVNIAGTAKIESGGNFHAHDNVKFIAGTDEDLQIFYNSSANTNEFTSPLSTNFRGKNLYFYVGANVSSEQAIMAYANAQVELYYDNSKKFETTSAGATVSGALTLTSHLVLGNNDEIKLGSSSQMTIWHTGSDFNMYNNTGQLIISNASGTGVGEGAIVFKSGNNNTRWYIASDGHFYPASNNTFDIGTTSNRVRNIYTNDLHLSNEGGANDVDGTWGSYTIQEGAEDLFLVNKRSGKKYKFALTEVS